MTPDPISRYGATARAARARHLAGRYPAAAQVLTFYAKLTEYLHDEQRGLVATALQISPLDSVSLVHPLLDWLAREAPPALAQATSALRGFDGEEWARYFSMAFTDRDDAEPHDSTAVFVAEAIVQGQAERDAAAYAFSRTAPATATAARCPVCSCAPVVGVLREEGHGAKHSLVCARCSREWPYPRITCPSCGEQEFDALPRYTAELYDYIRIDACDRCRRYLKTIDLTKDGLAVPQVDDLASLPLDLWAREHGYRRLCDNLLRT